MTTNTTTLTLDLPPTPEAPALARRAVERLELDEIQRSTVTLLTSELVTNAVWHAPNTRPIRLQATIRERRLRLSVTDSGRGFAAPARPLPDDRGGYGLFLVEQLAGSWGVAGSTVWFELPTATAS